MRLISQKHPNWVTRRDVPEVPLALHLDPQVRVSAGGQHAPQRIAQKETEFRTEQEPPLRAVCCHEPEHSPPFWFISTAWQKLITILRYR